MRDVKKNIDEGKRILHRHEGLIMRAGEMRDLIEISQSAKQDSDFIFELMNNAYLVGLAIGRRNAPKQRKKAV